MKTDLFVVCEAGNYGHHSNVNLLGIFDTMFAPSAPATHVSLTVAAILKCDLDECGEHHATIDIVDADGAAVAAVFDGAVHCSCHEDKNHGVHKLLCTLQNHTFEKFGEYAVRLRVDDRLISETPLFLLKTEEQPA